MSAFDLLPELDDLGDSVSGVDIRVISGAYNNTIDAFVGSLFQSIRNMVTFGFSHTSDNLLPQVARKTGATRVSILNMFTVQLVGLVNNRSIRIMFDRKLLQDPFWLKYHDIEWDLNPKFSSGYRKPTTPNTRPFSEVEWILQLFNDFVSQIITEWTKLGFNFTIRRS